MAEATDLQPPRKRSRSNHELDMNTNENTVMHSTNFWFKDGSIVLQAETTQFRVHSTMLARHSSVFGDMFEIPQPAEGEPRVEGCLLVHVSDSAEDIGHMLSSMYDRTTSPDKLPTFAHVVALLRLGKKYDIEYQYKEALHYLQQEFPSTLSQYKARRGRASIGIHRSQLIDLVNVALETNTLSILPAVYLKLASYPATTIFAGFVRPDGSSATLPSTAQQACIIGKEKILTNMYHMTYSWLDPGKQREELVSPVCTNPSDCMNAFDFSRVDLMGVSSTHAAFYDASIVSDAHTFCSKCQAVISQAHEAGRLDMWSNLPLYFSFTSWKDII